MLVLVLQKRSAGEGLPTNPQNPKQISVVIVPHFDFFKDKRQEFLAGIAKDYQPKTIILVSTNHFNAGIGNIISSKKDWHGVNGTAKIASSLFDKISSSNLISADDTPFDNEHGINNIIPDLLTTFSEAEILPIIIKDQASVEEITKLNESLKENCSDCLLVSSVDFSHYQSNSLAQIHDTFSLAALNNLDEAKIVKAETDSPPTLLLSLKWAKNQKDQKFSLFYNDNSGNVSANDSVETTSTIIGSYSFEDQPKAEKSTTFLIGGDLMFDRNVYHNYKDKGLNKIFDLLGIRTFWGLDLAMANLEGPISSKEINDDWQSGSMVFNFPPETTNALKQMNFNALSLANNHTLNAGASGFANTKKVLAAANIKYAGSQEDFNADNLMRIDSDIPISVITLDQLVPLDQSSVVSMIKKEKAANRFVLVVPHWGVEYEERHDGNQSRLAKSWIDAGADMVVGGHPHVTQDAEVYKNRPIFYSLGNFVFDQYFSRETQEGLLLGGIISKDKITLSLFPIKSKLSQPQMMIGSEKAAKIKTILDLDSATGFTKVRSDTIEIKR